jgi:arabinoxylan arabinofuranohydrolase
VYGDRVYLYMTGDEPMKGTDDKPRTNDYSNITTLRVLSSADLVNWEDHGSVKAAGGSGAARWASNSWAPCAAWKTVDGKDKFFLYFANSGGGIGVLTADSPTGPFTDPLGKPLISRMTPTCSEVTWLFDPAVLVDEDGSAYLYFGGGIPEGKASDPGTARVVKLKEDMISLDGDPVAINPPWLFEDSGINRIGDTYVYSYCSNFNVPGSGSAQGFGGGEIVYMISDNPMGPFTYAGQVLKNPGTFFGVGGNNHHCMFSFRDQWYITYHAATVDRDMGWNAGYRSTFVDRLELNEKGLPAPSRGTYAGVAQTQALDPYVKVNGATAESMAGATTELAEAADKKAGTGTMMTVSTTPGGWVCVSGADFGTEGAGKIRAAVRSEVPGRIEVAADSPDGQAIAAMEIPACEENTEVEAVLSVTLTGVHDVYFRFTESGTALAEWKFE